MAVMILELCRALMVGLELTVVERKHNHADVKITHNIRTQYIQLLSQHLTKLHIVTSYIYCFQALTYSTWYYTINILGS